MKFLEVAPSSRKEWRKWLKKNHKSSQNVWLILAKKESGIPSLAISEAVEESLCFGWIDSVANKVDENRFKIRISPRSPKSKWSKINKDRVRKLMRLGLMEDAGIKVVESAKKSGTWTALDKVENLELPKDLKKAFVKNRKVHANFSAFPRSAKKAILDGL